MKLIFSLKKLLTLDLNQKRIFGLDILRFLAIVFVLIMHSLNYVPKRLSPLFHLLIYDGVVVFFVLSGFLIGSIFIKTVEKEGASWKTLYSFWIKRWFRTIPNYLLILFILIIVDVFVLGKYSFKEVIPYFFFSQNLFTAPISIFGHSWSLAVEEWFYLLIPFSVTAILIFSKSSLKKTISFISLFILLLIFFSRLYYYFSVGDYSKMNHSALIYSVYFRIDSIMYGVVGAYVSYFYPKFFLKHQYKLLVVAIVMFLAYIFVLRNINLFFNVVLQYPFISLTTLFALPYCSQLKTGPKFLVRPITFISLISYSLYLLNSIIERIIDSMNWEFFDSVTTEKYWSLILLLKLFLFWFSSIFLSTLLYKYFEIPTTKLREKFS